MRILLFDIETSPIISYNWRLWKSNAIDVVEDWQILCFAYKWLGEKKTRVVGQDDFKGWKPGVNNDTKLVQALHALFNEADVIIAHNGDKFDIKRANTRFMVHHLKPPEPYRTIDTLKVARKVGAFSSNKLDYLVQQLDLGEKIDSGGIETLKDVLAGKKKAWKELKQYNKVDIDILEKLYLTLRPWMTNHPSLAIYNDMPASCPKCGSEHLRRGGFFATKVGKRKRYQCLECGGWCSGRLIESTLVEYVD